MPILFVEGKEVRYLRPGKNIIEVFLIINVQEIYEQFIDQIKKTTLLEYIAVITGIGSVWFSRIENILVYPVGLISTVIYTYISIQGDLYGEASVQLYYTIMSIYGWVLWTKKDKQHHNIVVISFSTPKELLHQLLFFVFFYLSIFFALSYLKHAFFPGVIPWADAFASATAFTGMWLMARKKVESWYWWMATNIASVPLFFVKNYMLTSAFYFVLLILAFWGLAEWKNRARQNAKTA